MKKAVKYPDDLVAAILCWEGERDVVVNNFTKDRMLGLEYALSTLSDNERKVIMCRFQKSMTLKSTGETMNLSTERIRQIEAKALRKLRHPLLVLYITKGYVNIEKIRSTAKRKPLYVEELNLSNRCKIALRRHRIDTIDKLMEIVEPDEGGFCKLMELRGIGRIGFKAIMDATNAIKTWN